jgi:hypothetical protein
VGSGVALDVDADEVEYVDEVENGSADIDVEVGGFKNDEIVDFLEEF